jgi:hypothetical protein
VEAHGKPAAGDVVTVRPRSVVVLRGSSGGPAA